MTEMTPEQLEMYNDWIYKNPNKFELFRQMIADFYDKRYCRIEKMIVSSRIFPFSGFFMGIKVETTNHQIVDETGKEHFVIFITTPK